jgi:hypothetical protein
LQSIVSPDTLLKLAKRRRWPVPSKRSLARIRSSGRSCGVLWKDRVQRFVKDVVALLGDRLDGFLYLANHAVEHISTIRILGQLAEPECADIG